MVHDQQRIGPPPPQILETEIDEEISLYDPLTENVLVLNLTASDIWRLSDGDSTFDQILHLLAGAYGVAPHQIRDEVEETIRNLQEQGFLQLDQA
jgi:hypothetical protein